VCDGFVRSIMEEEEEMEEAAEQVLDADMVSCSCAAVALGRPSWWYPEGA